MRGEERIQGKAGESRRCFSEARHPLREKGRDLFLAERFGNELKSLVQSPNVIGVFGSGDGKEVTAIGSVFPDAVVVSLDLSMSEISSIPGDRRKSGEFVCGDWDHLPFRDHFFDLVVFFAALHHSENLTHTLQEVYRVLRPGGWIYATHEPMSSLFLGWFQKGNMARTADEQEGIETSPSLWDYKSAFRQAGFESVSIQASTLNLVRFLDMSNGFEDVRRRRSDLPEKFLRACLRGCSFLGESLLLNLIFFIQRLLCGFYGVTIRARRDVRQ